MRTVSLLVAVLALFWLPLTSYSQQPAKSLFVAADSEAPFQTILAAGCGLFLVEEIGMQGSKFLQAFELEQTETLEPRVNDLVRTISAARANPGSGANTYQRYLSRLEVAVAAQDYSNLTAEDLVTMPVDLKQSVAISKQSANELNNYQLVLMESASGNLFRARRDSFLSIFPDQNKAIQISSIMSLCPSMEGLEEAVVLLD